MIQIYVGDLLITGITEANVEKLKAGQPLSLDLSRPTKQIVLVYGMTKIDMLQEFEKAGLHIPDNVREKVEQDPL